MIDAGQIETFFAGVILTGIAAIMFIRSRISPSEAQDIYSKTMKAINDYKAAMADGTLTADEKIKLAEETMDVISTFIKDLES